MMDHEPVTKLFSRSVLIFIIGFVAGILFASLIFLTPLVSLLLVVIGGAILVGEKIYKKVISPEVLLLSIFIFALSFGILRFAIKDFHEVEDPTPTGIVVSEPEQRDNATRFVFLTDNGERVLVSTDLYSPVEYGDRVMLEGKFERPGIIEGELGRNFDYAAYLSKDDIYHTMSFAKVSVESSGHGHKVKSLLLEVKSSFVERIRETFAEPYASLLAGLIVAGRDAMPKDYLDEFRRAGIIHIVVLSGYNITIIAEFLRKLFEKIFLHSRFTAIPTLAPLASIGGIVLFVLMTGAEATVVRAALMVLTVIAAKMLGRRYSATRALLLAGFIMLLENPKILVFDPSFQLSFLATLALIYVVPIAEKYLWFIPEKMTLRTTISTTIATQITVLPLLIYMMGEISLVSLPANLLVLLIIPYTMLLGFVSVLITFLSALVAWPLAFITNIFLWWIMGVSGVLGNLNFATISVPKISFVLVILIYTTHATWVWKKGSSPHKSAN